MYAFPRQPVQRPNGAIDRDHPGSPGMTYQEWLLGQILQGFAASLVDNMERPLTSAQITGILETCWTLTELATAARPAP